MGDFRQSCCLELVVSILAQLVKCGNKDAAPKFELCSDIEVVNKK